MTRNTTFLHIGFGLLMLGVINPASADDIALKTDLKAATIYAGYGASGQALLSRQASVSLPQGDHVLIIDDLPANIITSSLQASAQGSAQAVLGAVSYKQINNLEITDAQKKELTAQKEKLQYQIKMLQAEKSALQKQQSFLDFINTNAAQQTKEEAAKLQLSPQNWLEAAAALGKGSEDNLKAMLQKDQAVADLQDQMKKIDQDLAQLGRSSKRSLQVSIPLEVTSAGNAMITLSYQIAGMSWSPLYDARLNSAEETLAFKQYANVSQNTGENWKDIKLTLSTARPQQGASLPPLQPNWVSLANNKRAETLSNFAGSSAMAELDVAPRSKVMLQQNAALNTQGIDVTYAIPGLISIPSDGSKSKIYITDYDIKTKLESHIMPQQSAGAYLIAQATLQGEAALLPGQVNLFRDGSSIGQSYIERLRPQQEAKLPFGKDDRIAVEYKLLDDEKDESWRPILKDQIQTKHSKTIITSSAQKPLDIIVLQNIPAAKDAKITVKLLEDKTSAGYEENYQDVKGALAWKQSLKPGQEASYTLGYEISWPKDQTLIGRY